MKSLIFVLLISVVLVISGCGPAGKGTNIGGVDMEFQVDRPPLGSIPDEQTFSVDFVLNNKLTREVSDVKLCIYDTAPESAGGIIGKPCQTVTLPPADKLDGKIVPSRVGLLYFPENGGKYAYTVGQQGVSDVTIHAELTYTANSIAVIKSACFKKSSDIETDFECESQEEFTGNDIDADPAPIIVTRVEKNIYPEGTQNRLKLTLYLTKAEGEVIWNEDETKNLMDIKISSSDAQDFVCSPSENGLIKFDENTEKIICDSEFSLSQDFYRDSIVIELYYKYRSKLSSGPITIEKKRDGG
ncbi:hypothetical protein J4438_01665 [Candidatus Woesearchaeota archaeon]|nr:hypothetical protein [Candidatus Woesearchaeota archaeon]